MNRTSRTPILDVCVRAEFHTVLLVSVYLLFAGHNQPGGGFPGGLVAGAAFVLRYLAGGADDVRRAARLSPFAFLGAGLLLATVTVLVPLAFGGTLLEHGSFGADAPVLGSVKVTSALVLDSGVYLVVVGLVLLVLTSLGATGDGPVGPAPAEATEEVDA